VKKREIPKRLEHLTLISLAGNIAQQKSEAYSEKHSVTLMMIGTSLSALYQAATCYRQCFNNGHVLEALAGRTYNLGCAAYLLINQGFYDEALNLIRSIGEISNLIQLSSHSNDALRKWLDSDETVRKKEFSPLKVRLLIEETGNRPFVVDKDWYSKFCEGYTHITPNTKPNLHNDIDLGIVGGVFQEKGFEYSLDQLATLLCVTGAMICAYFNFDDLLAEMKSYISDSETEK
jgi:hypothetical protein